MDIIKISEFSNGTDIEEIARFKDKTLKKEGKSSLLSTIIAAVCQTNISINIEIVKYLLFFNEY